MPNDYCVCADREPWYSANRLDEGLQALQSFIHALQMSARQVPKPRDYVHISAVGCLCEVFLRQLALHYSADACFAFLASVVQHTVGRHTIGQ